MKIETWTRRLGIGTGILVLMATCSIATTQAARPMVYDDASEDSRFALSDEGSFTSAPTETATTSASPACHSCGNVSCCTCGGGNDRLFGLLAHSDFCYCDFISPVSNPLFFEDPRTLTEVRTIFAQHWIPDNNPVFQGGTVQCLAVQLRAALTERLSLLATKDGYLWINAENPAIPDEDGWADVTLGLKYNLYADPELQRLLSAGLTYELDVGSNKVFQGSGSGEFHLFASGGALLPGNVNWLSGAGVRLPTDNQDRSQMLYWSNHWSTPLIGNLYGLVEVNWFHWLSSGNRLDVDFEGNDLFNLGATDVTGNDIVTGAVGGRWRFGRMNSIGAAYEIPLTERRDLLESRLYADLIIRY